MNPLWSNIFRKKADEESLAGFLGSIPVFSDLNPRDLKFLESLVHVRNFKPHETVFEEGDPGSGMYLIRTGRVKVLLRRNDGREDELAQLVPGDFFGETTLAAPAPRTATVRTQDTTELIGLFRADLLEAAQKHPGIANKLLFGLTRVVSERLQAAAHEIARLRTADTAPAPALTPEEDNS